MKLSSLRNRKKKKKRMKKRKVYRACQGEEKVKDRKKYLK